MDRCGQDAQDAQIAQECANRSRMCRSLKNVQIAQECASWALDTNQIHLGVQIDLHML